MATAPNWFAEGGEAYARYRPDYPDALAAFLAGIAPATDRAADVGCGNGQFTCQLARHFAEVIGLDPSEAQIDHAFPDPRVRYLCRPAEALGLPDRSLDLVTAAQAAHWFDRPAFYAEVRRVLVPGGVVALVSYGVPECDGEIGPRFDLFYRDEIGPWWPPERRLVETGYAGIDFPFAELPFRGLAIERDWDLAAFLGYVSTWSAVRNGMKNGQGAVVEAFGRDLAASWDDPQRTRRVRWPITMRLGRV